MPSLLASVCHHRVSYFFTPIGPPELCEACEAFEAAEEAVDEHYKHWQVLDKSVHAEDAVDRLGLLELSLGEKRSFFRARAALANLMDQFGDCEDPRLPTVDREGNAVLTYEDPVRAQRKARSARTRKLAKVRVRIADDQDHRPESQYRDSYKYRRRHPFYYAGRYADTTGSGFWNTSDPVLWLSVESGIVDMKGREHDAVSQDLTDLEEWVLVERSGIM